jgi:isopentenyl phosphate kinase
MTVSPFEQRNLSFIINVKVGAWEVPEKRNVILKIGGSVITRKDSGDFPLSPNEIWRDATRFVRSDVVRRICSEIKESLNDLGYLILVHGAGVFGHFLVSKFLESDVHQQELVGWPLTSYSVLSENLILVNEMLNNGIPAISVPPRSLFTVTARDKDRPWVGADASFDSEKVRHLLPRYVPVLFGDLVFDEYGKPAVLSGDTVLYLCARELKDVDLVACGTDVGGIFTDDPKSNPNAELIERINLAERDSLKPKGSSYRDVDGGMGRKFKELISVGTLGVRSIVFDAMQEGNVLQVLKGKHIGTLIMP